MNAAWIELLRNRIVIGSDVSCRIRDRLKPLFDGGLRLFDGVLSTNWFWTRRGNATLENCHDATGLECHVNRFHLDDEFSSSEWVDAACQMEEILASRSQGFAVRFIATIEGDACTARFHLRRLEQDWLAPDLNAYSSAVMYRDIGS